MKSRPPTVDGPEGQRTEQEKRYHSAVVTYQRLATAYTCLRLYAPDLLVLKLTPKHVKLEA